MGPHRLMSDRSARFCQLILKRTMLISCETQSPFRGVKVAPFLGYNDAIFIDVCLGKR